MKFIESKRYILIALLYIIYLVYETIMPYGYTEFTYPNSVILESLCRLWIFQANPATMDEMNE